VEPDPLSNEGWVNNRWRPAMAWSYFLICLCDFVVFPVFTSVWFAPSYHEWHPLTLQGGGLYHMAMGAIIGIATWQRTQEKLAIYKSDLPGSTVTEEHSKSSTTTVIPAEEKTSRAD
jgi:hypothetical protein